MTIVSPMGQLRPVFADKNGKRLSGGKVFTYEPGTLTPKATYSDSFNLLPNTNPIELDASGEADIFLNGDYRIQVFDRYGVMVNDYDNFQALASKVYLDTVLSGFVNGAAKFYPTLAAAKADIANIAVNQPVNIGELENGGSWYKESTESTELTKTPYDALELAKNYSNQKQILQEDRINDLFQDKGQQIEQSVKSTIEQQGVSQQQLQNYYLFLLNQMANLSSNKNWLASLIVDASGKNQQQINTSTLEKTYSLIDAGGQGIGNNDTSALNAAINQASSLTFDTQDSIIDQTLLTKTIEINGKLGSVRTTQANKHIFYLGANKDSTQEINGTLIKNQKIRYMKFMSMPKATQDDFAAVTLAQTQNGQVVGCEFYDVENAVSVQSTPSKYGKIGEGSKDSLIEGIYVYKARRFVLQNIQGSYTRFINNVAHNDGDNSTVPTNETNNGGWNGGVRLAGLGRGNIIGGNIIRDRYTSVDFQRGQEYNVVESNYFENTFSNSVNASTTNLAAGGYHSLHGQMIVNAGATGVRLNYLGLVHGSAEVHGAAVYGMDTYPSIDGEEIFIVSFTGATGVVPALDSILTQGSVTCKVHQVRAENLSIVAPGAAMPPKGTILIKSLSGRLSKNTPFAELSATITNIKIGEGHHVFDGVVSQTLNSGIRVGTNGNNLRFNINACEEHPAIISGDFNNIVLVISERVTGKYVQITGKNNIITVIDNSKNTADTALSITGSDNTVTVNTRGRVLCNGSNNTLNVRASRLAVNGNNNACIGVADALIDGGAGNNYRGLKGGSTSGTVSLFTNSLGQVSLSHGLLIAAKAINPSIVGADPLLFATVASIAPNATTSTLQIWNANGTKAANSTGVTISYTAHC